MLEFGIGLNIIPIWGYRVYIMLANIDITWMGF